MDESNGGPGNRHTVGRKAKQCRISRERYLW